MIGSGTRFLSGISYYTHRLSCALVGSHDVRVILMRRLLPTRLYPGRARVGAKLTGLAYPPEIPVLDGVDWFWLPSLLRAVRFLVRQRPEVVVLQWWTGTVLHSYLVLAAVARLLGARVVMEFHEVLDTGELRLRAARTYVRLLSPLLVRLTDGAVVHSEFDRAELVQRYRLGSRPIALIPHGPYDHHRAPGAPAAPAAPDASATPDAPATPAAPVHPVAPASPVAPTSPAALPAEDDTCRLLFFGVIRPFKGVEDLIRAFDAIPEEEIGRYRLTVVGETWEDWTLPAELIAGSRHRDRIEFVNRYVTDDEVAGFFARADVVVLPYHRSSASGPLHVAMSHGLPVVITRVGGLIEAVDGYGGAIMVSPRDPAAIGDAIRQARELRGRRFADPHSWARTSERYDDLFAAIA